METADVARQAAPRLPKRGTQHVKLVGDLDVRTKQTRATPTRSCGRAIKMRRERTSNAH
jgi:hypothetical protein